MNELTQFLIWAQRSLMSVHWTLAVAVLAFGPFLTVLAVKKVLPEAWLWIEGHMPKDKSAQRIALGALIGIPTAALGVLGAGGNPSIAALAAFSSIWGPILHHFLKWVPFISYRGEVAEPKAPKGPPSLGGLAILVLLSVGCNGPRALCYAESDATYLGKVEECKAEGYSYATCPYLTAAERAQAEHDKGCK